MPRAPTRRTGFSLVHPEDINLDLRILELERAAVAPRRTDLRGPRASAQVGAINLPDIQGFRLAGVFPGGFSIAWVGSESQNVRGYEILVSDSVVFNQAQRFFVSVGTNTFNFAEGAPGETFFVTMRPIGVRQNTNGKFTGILSTSSGRLLVADILPQAATSSLRVVDSSPSPSEISADVISFGEYVQTTVQVLVSRPIIVIVSLSLVLQALINIGYEIQLLLDGEIFQVNEVLSTGLAACSLSTTFLLYDVVESVSPGLHTFSVRVVLDGTAGTLSSLQVERVGLSLVQLPATV